METPEVYEDPLIGRVIQDRYRIVRTLGKGGMGVVYEARHLLIGRTVALKTMAAHAAVSPASIERFRREANAAAAVGNSHVVDVLDMGLLDGGSFYIVLEHLGGLDLAFAVASSGRFAWVRAVHVIGQLCDALSAVHAAGIVHRDLKPDNVFLIERDGQPDFVKVLDFGVCKFQDAPGVTLTASGDMVGTPQFMAPEQVEGKDADQRTDIHALGALLFFVLTGRPPYEAATMPKLFGRICSDAPPSLRELRPELPEALDAIVRRALAKDPAARFQSCQALKSALLASAGPSDDLAATLADQSLAPATLERGPNDSTAGLARALGSLRSRTTRVIGSIAVLAFCAMALLAIRARARLVGELPERSLFVRDAAPEPAASIPPPPLVSEMREQTSVRGAQPPAVVAPTPVVRKSPKPVPPPPAPSARAEPAPQQSVSEVATPAPVPKASAASPSVLNPELKDGRL